MLDMLRFPAPPLWTEMEAAPAFKALDEAQREALRADWVQRLHGHVQEKFGEKYRPEMLQRIATEEFGYEGNGVVSAGDEGNEYVDVPTSEGGWARLRRVNLSGDPTLRKELSTLDEAGVASLPWPLRVMGAGGKRRGGDLDSDEGGRRGLVGELAQNLAYAFVQRPVVGMVSGAADLLARGVDAVGLGDSGVGRDFGETAEFWGRAAQNPQMEGRRRERMSEALAGGNVVGAVSLAVGYGMLDTAGDINLIGKLFGGVTGASQVAKGVKGWKLAQATLVQAGKIAGLVAVRTPGPLSERLLHGSLMFAYMMTPAVSQQAGTFWRTAGADAALNTAVTAGFDPTAEKWFSVGGQYRSTWARAKETARRNGEPEAVLKHFLVAAAPMMTADGLFAWVTAAENMNRRAGPPPRTYAWEGRGPDGLRARYSQTFHGPKTAAEAEWEAWKQGGPKPKGTQETEAGPPGGGSEAGPEMGGGTKGTDGGQGSGKPGPGEGGPSATAEERARQQRQTRNQTNEARARMRQAVDDFVDGLKDETFADVFRRMRGEGGLDAESTRIAEAIKEYDGRHPGVLNERFRAAMRARKAQRGQEQREGTAAGGKAGGGGFEREVSGGKATDGRPEPQGTEGGLGVAWPGAERMTGVDPNLRRMAGQAPAMGPPAMSETGKGAKATQGTDGTDGRKGPAAGGKGPAGTEVGGLVTGDKPTRQADDKPTEEDRQEFTGQVEILPTGARTRWRQGTVVSYAHGLYLVTYKDRTKTAADAESITGGKVYNPSGMQSEYVQADRLRYGASKATREKYRAEVNAEPEDQRRGIRDGAYEFDNLVRNHEALYDWREEGATTGESRKRDAQTEYFALKRAREAAADALDIKGDIHSPVVRARHLEALKLWIAGPGKTAPSAVASEGEKDHIEGKAPEPILGRELRGGDQVQVDGQWLIAEIDDEQGIVRLTDGRTIVLHGGDELEVAGGEIVGKSGEVRRPGGEEEGDAEFGFGLETGGRSQPGPAEDHGSAVAGARSTESVDLSRRTPGRGPAMDTTVTPEPRQGKLFPAVGQEGHPEQIAQGRKSEAGRVSPERIFHKLYPAFPQSLTPESMRALWLRIPANYRTEVCDWLLTQHLQPEVRVLLELPAVVREGMAKPAAVKTAEDEARVRQAKADRQERERAERKRRQDLDKLPQEIIAYTKTLDVRNLDALPKGVGARYLEVVKGEGGSYIAKQWRRNVSSAGGGVVLIDMEPEKAEAGKAPNRTEVVNQKFPTYAPFERIGENADGDGVYANADDVRVRWSPIGGPVLQPMVLDKDRKAVPDTKHRPLFVTAADEKPGARPERDAHDASAAEVKRLQELGFEMVRGIRLQEAEEAGKLAEMLRNGLITAADWDKYVERLYAEGRAPRPAAPPAVELPKHVKEWIDRHLRYVRNVAGPVEKLAGRYLWEVVTDKDRRAKLEGAAKVIPEALASIPEAKNRSAVEAYIEKQGGVPDIAGLIARGEAWNVEVAGGKAKPSAPGPELKLEGQKPEELKAETEKPAGQAELKISYENMLRGVIEQAGKWPEWLVQSAGGRLADSLEDKVGDYSKAQKALDGLLAAAGKQGARLTADSGVETQGDLFDKRPRNLFDAAAQGKAAGKPPAVKTADLGKMSPEDLDRLFDEVEGEMGAAPGGKEPQGGGKGTEGTEGTEDTDGEPGPAAGGPAPGPRRPRSPGGAPRPKAGPKAAPGPEAPRPGPEAAPGPEASKRSASAPKMERDADEILRDMARHGVKGAGEALKGLYDLFGGGGLKAGFPGIDEATYRKAKPHFEAAFREFAAAGRDLRDFIRFLLSNFGAGIRPYVKAFQAELAGQWRSGGQDDVQRSGGDLEPDRGGPGAGNALGAGGVPAGREGAGGQAGADAPGALGAEGGRAGATGVPDGDAAAGGARGDRAGGGQAGRPGSAGGAAGGADGERGGKADGDGLPADAAEAGGAEKAAGDGRGQDVDGAGEGVVRDRLAEQAAAETIAVVPADLANIRKTLPVLYQEQHDDVLRMERRYLDAAADTNRGMLITNGTGTGKTYSGLGLIKRMVKQGKGNVLIVTPNDAVMTAWGNAGKDLGLDIRPLTGITDGGTGVVMTTYANFQQNEALLRRDWDLLVFDEAHHVGSNQEGDVTLAWSRMDLLTANERSPNIGQARYAAELTEMARENDWSREVERRTAILQDRSSVLPAGGAPPPAWKTEKVRELLQPWEIVQRLRRLADPNGARQEGEEGKQATTAQLDLLARVDAAVEMARGIRTLFLSATPWAYQKNVLWGDGFLFDTGARNPDLQRSGAYNAGGPTEQFMMQHFGYRMRYNRLTQPAAGVDPGVMERGFHEFLRRSGALWGRMLTVDKDYSRQFIDVESKLGSEIERGLSIIYDFNDKRFERLRDAVRKKYDWHYTLLLMEGLKARASVPRIKQHLALGRKVVVFHARNQGVASHPFDIVPRSDREKKELELFHATYPEFRALEVGTLSNTADRLAAVFGDAAVIIRGGVGRGALRRRIEAFQDDASPVKVAIVQLDKGKEGVSLHDLSGRMPRVMLSLCLPLKPTDLCQTEGRIYRLGVQSNATMEYLKTGLSMENWAFGTAISERADTAENLAMGNRARRLRSSIRDGYLNSETVEPHAGQGVGGREADGRAEDTTFTPYDEAISHYHARAKRTAKRRDQLAGVDFFPTPEPLGFKMVEWLGLKPGDKFLEPSAGDGAIARYAPETTTNRFVEPSHELAAKLRVQADGEVIQGDFMEYSEANKFDGIAMNPPFGQGGKDAALHVAKAFAHLKPGGRLIAIVPEGSPSIDKRFDDWLAGEPEAVKVREIGLPPVTFEKGGTKVRTRVLVVDRVPAGMEHNVPGTRYDLAGENIEELFASLRDKGMPDRLDIISDRDAIERSGMSLESRYQKSTDSTIYLLTVEPAVRERYQRLVTWLGGKWSKKEEAYLFAQDPQERLGDILRPTLEEPRLTHEQRRLVDALPALVAKTIQVSWPHTAYRIEYPGGKAVWGYSDKVEGRYVWVIPQQRGMSVDDYSGDPSELAAACLGCAVVDQKGGMRVLLGEGGLSHDRLRLLSSESHVVQDIGRLSPEDIDKVREAGGDPREESRRRIDQVRRIRGIMAVDAPRWSRDGWKEPERPKPPPPAPPAFQVGDRVVIKGEGHREEVLGRHGTIVEANRIEARAMFGSSSVVSYSYKIQTDGGYEVYQSDAKGLEKETGERMPVVADIDVRSPGSLKPYFRLPTDVMDVIRSARMEYRQAQAAAGRAKSESGRRARRLEAAAALEKAEKLTEKWSDWAQNYPREVERLFGAHAELAMAAGLKERPSAAAGAPGAAGRGAVIMDIATTMHAHKGIKLWVVTMPRVPTEEYRRLERLAKQHGGYWSSYAKEGAIPGWQFTAAEAAEAFRGAAGFVRPMDLGGRGEDRDGIVSEQEAAYGQGTDIEAVAEGIGRDLDQALADSAGVVAAGGGPGSAHTGWGKPPVLLGPAGVSSVPGDWKKLRRIDYVGRQVKSSDEVAALWTAYRHPRIELFSVVYVDAAGKILAHNTLCAGLANAAPAVEHWKKWSPAILRRMARLGAVGYYLVHNHPAGSLTPSAGDINVLRAYTTKAPGLLGSLILDHDKYAVMRIDPKTQYVDLQERVLAVPGRHFTAETEKRPELLGNPNIEMVAKAALRGTTQAALLWYDPLRRVVAWDPIGADLLTPQEVHRRAMAYGVMDAAVVTDTPGIYEKWLRRLQDDQTAPLGHVQDVFGLFRAQLPDGSEAFYVYAQEHSPSKRAGFEQAKSDKNKASMKRGVSWVYEPKVSADGGEAGGPPPGAAPVPGGPGLEAVASAAEGFVPTDDEGSRYFLRRYLLWGRYVGGRRPWVNEEDFRRRGSMEADRHLAAERAKGLRTALAGLEGRQDGPEIVERLNAVLRGDLDADRAGLPNDAQAQAALQAVTAAREWIDGLSTRIVRDLKGQLPESLGLMILDNRGKYVMRAYEKFANRDYQPADQVVGEAREFLAGELARQIDAWEEKLGAVGDKYKREEFRRKMAEYIATGNEELLDGMSGSFQHLAHRARAFYEAASKRLNGLLGIRLEDGKPKLSIDAGDAARLTEGTLRYLMAKDTDLHHIFRGAAPSPQWRQIRKSFMRRKDIPLPIRRLWGEIHDIAAVVQMTSMRQMQVLTAHRFQKQILEHSETLPDGHKDKLFYQHPTSAGGRDFSFPLSSPTFGTLGGLFTDRATFDMLDDSERMPMQEWWMRAYMTAVVAPRYTHTVLNVPTVERNFLSNFRFALAEGEMLRPVSYVRAWRQTMQQILHDPDAIRAAMRLGVVSESANASELKATLTEAFGSTEMFTPQGFYRRLWAMVKAGGNKAAALYALCDNVHKLASYNAKALRGVPKAEAARAVRDAYPYYDMAPLLVTRGLRRTPLVPDFLTFRVEMLRIAANDWQRAVTAMKRGDIRPMAGTVAAQGMATRWGQLALGTAAAAVLGWLAQQESGEGYEGVETAEQDDMRRLLPQYRSTGNLMVWRGPDGRVQYVDLSYIHPDTILGEITVIAGGEKPVQEKMHDLAGALRQDWIGIPMGAEMLAELAANRNAQTGEEIYSETDTFIEAVQKWAAHLTKRWVPSSAIYLRNAAELLTQEGERETASGELQTVAGEVGKAVTPMRVYTFEPEVAFTARMREVARVIADLKRSAGTEHNRYERGYGDLDKTEGAAERADEKLSIYVTDIAEGYMQAAARWMTDRDMERLMRDAGISMKDAQALLGGRGLSYNVVR